MNSIIVFTNLLILSCAVYSVLSSDAAQETVSKHGQLSVSGNKLVDANGQNVQLKGMSLFWDVWMDQYYDPTSIEEIKTNCHGNVVRAAIAVTTEFADPLEPLGYLFDPETSRQHVTTVVEAAIAADIYVIVDWHEGAAETHVDAAVEFFDWVSKTYGSYPNVIYETFNEPEGQSWSGVLKPYHETIIKTIRANDPDNVIICGTPTWSQSVDQAAADPISDQTNIMYTLHFYAGTHKQWLRDTATNALNNGIAIFVTEYGTVNADGDGAPDEAESRLWWDWMDQNDISYANWSIADKLEGASVLQPNTTSDNVCVEEFLTASGKLVIAQNQK